MPYDIDLNMKRNLENDIGYLKDSDSIKNEVMNLIDIAKNQKLFNLNWGFGIRTYLHEPYDGPAVNALKFSLLREMQKMTSIVNPNVNLTLKPEEKIIEIDIYYIERRSGVEVSFVEFLYLKKQ